jgi:hypothetical protein
MDSKFLEKSQSLDWEQFSTYFGKPGIEPRRTHRTNTIRFTLFWKDENR